MAGKCEICGKAPMFGHNVSHSVRRTARSFKPNTHKMKLMLDGSMRSVTACTQCLRTLQKAKVR